MNLVININEPIFNNIYFNDPIKNTVMNDSNFIRILYSNSYFVLNGIYIKINLIKNNEEFNNNIIISIDKLERHILNLYNNKKNHLLKLKEQINYFIDKLNNSKNINNISYMLKISGIWETDLSIGITFKFISYF
tara:strand:- start:3245 stop:3649 length:405 start_codon:yes stop_codon:yes gene_type:complete